MSKSSKTDHLKANWLFDVNEEKNSDFDPGVGQKKIPSNNFFDGPHRGPGQLGRAWEYDEKKIEVD